MPTRIHQPHRGKIEIIQQILSFVDKRIDVHNQGTIRQQILFGVCLNHIQLTKYLAFLVDNDLLTEDKEPVYFRANSYVYRITPKGILFLKLYEEMNKNDYVYTGRRKVLVV